MKIEKAYIEITNRCNLNCRDCYNSSGLSSKPVEISADTLLHIFQSLYNEFKVSAFDISGGEPILHSEWHRILDIMERLSHLSFFFVTNGTVRDDRFYELLEKDKRFRVQFSIDGIDEKTHSIIRGAGNFSKTIGNLLSLKPANSPVIKMVITAFNFHQIEDYFKFAAEYGCIPAFSFVEKLGNADTNWDEMRLDDYEKISVLEKIVEMSDKYGIKVVPPYAAFSCPITRDEPIIVCIKQNGNIQPCQNFYDDRFAIGSIYDLDFNKISMNLERLKKQLIKRSSMDYNCSRCINRELCDRGCGASAFMHHGDILANDGSCRFKTLQTIKFNLIAKLKEKEKGDV